MFINLSQITSRENQAYGVFYCFMELRLVALHSLT